jgi:hypothetical protein
VSLGLADVGEPGVGRSGRGVGALEALVRKAHTQRVGRGLHRAGAPNAFGS